MQALTELDLTDPATLPNPFIKDLIDIAHRLHRMSMEGGPGAGHYYDANQKVLSAVTDLFEVKNELAGEL